MQVHHVTTNPYIWFTAVYFFVSSPCPYSLQKAESAGLLRCDAVIGQLVCGVLNSQQLLAQWHNAIRLESQQLCCQNLRCWILKCYLCIFIDVMSFIQGVSFVAAPNTAALSHRQPVCAQDIWWQLQCWGHWQKKHTVHAGVTWFCYCIQSSPLPSVENNIRCVNSKQTDDMADSTHSCVEILLFCIHTSFDPSMGFLYVLITSSGHQKHYSSMQVHH